MFVVPMGDAALFAAYMGSGHAVHSPRLTHNIVLVGHVFLLSTQVGEVRPRVTSCLMTRHAACGP